MYPKFLIFKLLNVSNKDALSVRKRLLRSTINKRNKEPQHIQISHNKKSLEKLLNTQDKKLFSLTRKCSLPTFTSNKAITNITQYELSLEESYILNAGLYFSMQLDKIQKSEI